MLLTSDGEEVTSGLVYLDYTSSLCIAAMIDVEPMAPVLQAVTGHTSLCLEIEGRGSLFVRIMGAPLELGSRRVCFFYGDRRPATAGAGRQ